MKRADRPGSEADVAAPVVAWLRALDWRVYQEVDTGGGRPDIVATWRDRLIWIVEVKRTLSWDLLAQAASWRGHAHRVSVAVPVRREHRTEGPPRRDGMPTFRAVEREVLDGLGIGMLTVGAKGASEIVAPRLHLPARREVQRWWARLRPEHEAGFAAAGTNGGGYFTPFRGTVRAMTAEARDRPGMTTKELVAAARHHYGSDAAAARNMVRWIGTTALEGSGLVARRDGAAGPWRWSVDPAAETLGRCREPTCSLAAAASCERCGGLVCPLDLDSHRCRCTGGCWGRRGAVRHCRCRSGAHRAPLCDQCDLCAGCEREQARAEREAHPPPWAPPASPATE